MAQPFAKSFYASFAWEQCRAAYKKKAGGLCERCLKKGLIVPGVIVHHREHLTPQNISNPNIALGFNNLELLCRECHDQEHETEITAGHRKTRKNKRRYWFDKGGNMRISS